MLLLLGIAGLLVGGAVLYVFVVVVLQAPGLGLATVLSAAPIVVILAGIVFLSGAVFLTGAFVLEALRANTEQLERISSIPRSGDPSK